MTQGEKIDKIYDICLEIAPIVSDLKDDYYGTGSNPGTKIEVDRLKVFKKVCCWFLCAFTVAGFGLIAKLVYSSLTAA